MKAWGLLIEKEMRGLGVGSQYPGALGTELHLEELLRIREHKHFVFGRSTIWTGPTSHMCGSVNTGGQTMQPKEFRKIRLERVWTIRISVALSNYGEEGDVSTTDSGEGLPPGYYIRTLFSRVGIPNRSNERVLVFFCPPFLLREPAGPRMRPLLYGRILG